MHDSLRRQRGEKRKRRGNLQQFEDLQLHDYQQEMTDKILDAFSDGQDRVYGESPTGSGKTYMMLYIIHKLWSMGNGSQRPSNDRAYGQVLILVGSISLADQTKREAEKVLRSQLKHRCRIEVEQGESRTDGEADLTIATWQGLDRSEERIAKFDPLFFGLVIVDECHHAVSPNHLLLQYFHEDVTLQPETRPTDGLKNGHRVKLLGLTATSQRVDGIALELAFPHKAYVVDIRTLMEQGKLTKLLYATVNGELDIKYLLQFAEDDAGEDEEEDFDENDDRFYKCNRSIVQYQRMWHRAGNRKYTLVFCQRLKQVWSLKAAFRRANIGAEAITGKTPRDQRTRLMVQFKLGLFPCLINCMALTEGTDLPCVDLLIVAKPSRNPSTWKQMVGRGLRTSHATKKVDCLVLDFTVSNSTGMQLVAELHSLAETVPNQPREPQDRKSREDDRPPGTTGPRSFWAGSKTEAASTSRSARDKRSGIYGKALDGDEIDIEGEHTSDGAPAASRVSYQDTRDAKPNGPSKRSFTPFKRSLTSVYKPDVLYATSVEEPGSLRPYKRANYMGQKRIEGPGERGTAGSSGGAPRDGKTATSDGLSSRKAIAGGSSTERSLTIASNEITRRADR